MAQKKVNKKDRKQWAREHFRGFENVLMPSFNADLSELDEEGIRLDVRQSIKHGFFSSLCALETGLTMEEKKRMLSIATDEAGDKIGIALSLTQSYRWAILSLLVMLVIGILVLVRVDTKKAVAESQRPFEPA